MNPAARPRSAPLTGRRQRSTQAACCDGLPTRWSEELFATAKEQGAQLQATRAAQREALTAANCRDRQRLRHKVAAARQDRDAKLAPPKRHPFHVDLAADMFREDVPVVDRTIDRSAKGGNLNDDSVALTVSSIATGRRNDEHEDASVPKLRSELLRQVQEWARAECAACLRDMDEKQQLMLDQLRRRQAWSNVKLGTSMLPSPCNRTVLEDGGVTTTDDCGDNVNTRRLEERIKVVEDRVEAVSAAAKASPCVASSFCHASKLAAHVGGLDAKMATLVTDLSTRISSLETSTSSAIRRELGDIENRISSRLHDLSVRVSVFAEAFDPLCRRVARNTSEVEHLSARMRGRSAQCHARPLANLLNRCTRVGQGGRCCSTPTADQPAVTAGSTGCGSIGSARREHYDVASLSAADCLLGGAQGSSASIASSASPVKHYVSNTTAPPLPESPTREKASSSGGPCSGDDYSNVTMEGVGNAKAAPIVHEPTKLNVLDKLPAGRSAAAHVPRPGMAIDDNEQYSEDEFEDSDGSDVKSMIGAKPPSSRAKTRSDDATDSEDEPSDVFEDDESMQELIDSTP